MKKKIILYMTLFIMIVCLTACAQKDVVLKQDTFDIEYGENISTDLKDYIDVEKSQKDVLEKAQLDSSQVKLEKDKNYPSIGKYKLFIIYNEDKYEINITVKDTIAPEIKELTQSLVFIKDMKPTHEEILKNLDIHDLSQIQTSIDDSKVDYSQVGEYLAIVTASDSSQNETKKEVKITIKNPTITLNKHTLNLRVKQIESLKAKIEGKDNHVIYKSSNDKIVTVDSKGKITAKKEGSANIIATCNGVEDVCKVNVKGIYIKNAYEAISYVKEYLEDNHLYIPGHIGFYDESYGEKGYEIQGYDDMGDHIATSFWYYVSHDGKIYDGVMQKYILK